MTPDCDDCSAKSDQRRRTFQIPRRNGVAFLNSVIKGTETWRRYWSNWRKQP